MLLELSRDTVIVDGQPKLKDFKINLAPNRQLRMKYKTIDTSGVEVPVDIVVFNYTFPHLEGISKLVISAFGVEMNSQRNFKCELAFDFFKKIWKVNGSCGMKSIQEEKADITSAFLSIQKII